MDDKLQQAMTRAKMLADDLAEMGVGPMQIAIGFAYQMNVQADMAIPYPEQCRQWKEDLIS